MKKLSAIEFKEMLESANNNLQNAEQEINGLNVFPVPDGDTGTNMCLTFNNGYKEAAACLSNNIGDVAKCLSKGLLMGARGNSGVITSQIFRGFAKAVEGKEDISVNEVALAFIEGARVAYKAIMKPVEGTILTVIKEGSWYANHDLESNEFDLKEYFNRLANYANESLQRTPDLLPILKEAGVVDSGGAGLCKILEGFKAYIDGTPIVKKDKDVLILQQEEEKLSGYQVKLELKLNKEYQKVFDLENLKKRLLAVANKLKIDKAQNIVIEANTLKPGEVLNIAQRYGEFTTLNIESAFKEEIKESKPYGIICVCSGQGIENTFKELGADIIISGGQTMNPSTADFVKEIEALKHCEEIFILPNNSNIILAAEQAKGLVNQKVDVLPTKSIQAGISCLTMFDPSANKKDNLKTMMETIDNVKTASITYAIKDTSFEGVDVKAGDYLAILGKSIIDSSSDLLSVGLKTIDGLIKQDGELVTIIIGEGAKEEVSTKLVEYLQSQGNLEVQTIQGDQPVYSYLFALE